MVSVIVERDPDHVAGANADLLEMSGSLGNERRELGIADRALALDDRRMVWTAAGIVEDRVGDVEPAARGRHRDVPLRGRLMHGHEPLRAAPLVSARR